jgi:hypothetical protein
MVSGLATPGTDLDSALKRFGITLRPSGPDWLLAHKDDRG